MPAAAVGVEVRAGRMPSPPRASGRPCFMKGHGTVTSATSRAASVNPNVRRWRCRLSAAFFERVRPTWTRATATTIPKMCSTPKKAQRRVLHARPEVREEHARQRAEHDVEQQPQQELQVEQPDRRRVQPLRPRRPRRTAAPAEARSHDERDRRREDRPPQPGVNEHHQRVHGASYRSRGRNRKPEPETGTGDGRPEAGTGGLNRRPEPPLNSEWSRSR